MTYIGSRMSLNAVYAYDQGEKPLSKYNKEDAVMIQQFLINNFNISETIDIKVYQLKEFLELYGRSSWHHTGKFFNETDFYSFAYAISDGIETDLEYLEKDNIVQERLDEFMKIIQTKPERKKTSKKDESEKERQKDYYFADVEYGEWGGSRKHPKLYQYEDQALIYKNFAYLLKGNVKKSISGKHFYITNIYNNRKPKHFDKSSVNEIRKKLKLK